MARMPNVCRYGKVFSDDVVDLTIFLGERDAKVTPGDVAQVDAVLSHQRLVQAVFGFKVCTYFVA